MFARREIETSLSERTLLVALAIQIFVAGFSSFLVVGLASLVDPSAIPGGADVTVAVVGDGGVGPFLRSNGIHTMETDRNESAVEWFQNGTVDAILYVREETPWNATDPLQLELIVPEGDLRTTFTVARLKEALTQYEREVREARAARLTVLPPEAHVAGDSSEGGGFSFIYTLLIPLLVFLPVVLSGALVADAFTEEVQRGTLGILLSTPATLSEVVAGKLLGNAILAPLLAGVWLLLLKANGIAVAGVPFILLFATLAAVVLGGIACVVALATGDRHKAHLVYALLLFLLAAGASFLPQSPVNLVARFAADSADGVSIGLVLGMVSFTLAFVGIVHVTLARKGLVILALAEHGGAGPRKPKAREDPEETSTDVSS